MKIPGVSSAAREIAQWRQFFRRRGDDLPRRASGSGDDAHSTQWLNTEWSETQPESLALSESIDREAESP